MRRFLLLFLLLVAAESLPAQILADTIVMRRILAVGAEDSITMDAHLNLGRFYIDNNNDSSLLHAQKAYLLALKLKSQSYMAQGLDFLGAVLLRRGNPDQALGFLLQALKLFQSQHDSTYQIVVNRNIAGVYKSQADFSGARKHYLAALQIHPKAVYDSLFRSWVLMDFGDLYLKMNQTDSALFYAQQAYDMSVKLPSVYNKKYLPLALNTIGRIYQQTGAYDKALMQFKLAIQTAFENTNLQAASDNYLSAALVFNGMGQPDSAFLNAQKAYAIARQVNNLQAIEASSGFLKEYFREQHRLDSAFVYQEIMGRAKDSLLSLEKIRQTQALSFNEQLQQQQILAAEADYKNRVRIYVLAMGAGALFILAILLYRNNRHKQKANAMLQKQKQEIEKQKREADIEAALERVRARAMAMYKSEELKEVVKELRKQIGLLGQEELNTCVIQLWDESPDYIQAWVSIQQAVNNEEVMEFNGQAPKKGLHIIEESLQAYASGRKDYTLLNEKAKLKQWMDFLKESFSEVYEAIVESYNGLNPDEVPVYWSYSHFHGGALLMVTLAPPNDVSTTLLRKFANVFGLAYRRFVDLKQAEAQAREAQVQLALERLRARTMSMHQSSELAEVASVMFEQLSHLGVSLWICGFCNCRTDTELVEKWISPPDGKMMAPVYIPYTIDDFERHAYQAWLTGQQIYSDTLGGMELQKSHEQLMRHPSMQAAKDYVVEKKIALPAWVQHHAVPYKYGYLMIVTLQPFEEINIFTRIAKVFEQTYTRFLDLQRAEAQAREAQIETALERIRGRSMAMQKSEELAEVAALLFKQVNDLGIKTWTTGFNVWSKDNNFWVDYVTNPLGGFLEPYTVDTTQHEVLAEVREARKRGDKFFVQTVEGETLRELYRQLSKFGDKKQFDTIRESGFKFPSRQIHHFVFGSQVSLMFITYESVLEAHQIFKRFGKVFEQTYVRFLDLQKAEAQAVRAEQDLIKIKAARKKAEDTLATLKATQQQLIQQEKMASLGELTAGIAHEIQNPLNFVNNFSEATHELTNELEQELEQGNTGEAMALVANIRSNTEKVVYHGKRADSIVKGMLHHARASTGQKEPVDINKLAEEYLRLSYQGMRSKDKTFVATLQTCFAESMCDIPLVPQDIGRVLLNLYNNAFYAVSKKKEQLNGMHEPVVSVTTKRESDHLTITVSDNGIGIPQPVLNKIFQPFFTTKPTGEGTGLGLSLSYEIVTKGHGGTLTVQSRDGEGAVFVVSLPL